MWDAWNIVFSHGGHGAHETAQKRMLFGPFQTAAAADAMMRQMISAGLVPATHLTSVEPAPKKIFGHDVLPIQGGGYVIKPYDVVLASMHDVHMWLAHHVAASRKR